MSGGAYAQDKNASARLCTKNAGGAYVRGGAYLRDITVYAPIAFKVNSDTTILYKNFSYSSK